MQRLLEKVNRVPLHEDFHFRVTNGQRAEVKRACTAKEYPCFPRPLRHKEVFCFTSVSPQQLQIFNFIQKGLIMRERLTKSDVEKIKAEIEHRKLVERKELIEAVKEARSHGDLSENFEYHAAKKAKNQNESRIRYLERMLKTAEIVEDHSKADEIGLNNTVELYCEDDDEVETYRIVTSVRGSSLNGLVSIESPIGKALLEHKEGDRVYIKVNDDFGYYVVIRKVIKTEDEAEDHIRSF